jgi:hypothetical protein
MHAGAFLETIIIGDHSFDLTHIKFRASVNKKHQLALCAANRLVKEESIQGKFPACTAKYLTNRENLPIPVTCLQAT